MIDRLGMLDDLGDPARWIDGCTDGCARSRGFLFSIAVVASPLRVFAEIYE